VAFVDLAGALGPDRPVYGVQPRGLDGMDMPSATVEAAAEEAVAAISAIYPQGPLHLIGHSFGGWVVYEMARYLCETGRRPASLVLIDSQAPCRDDCRGHDDTDAEALMKLIGILEQAAERSLEISPADIMALTESERLELLHQRLVRTGLMPGRSKAEALGGMIRSFEAALRCHYRPHAVYPDTVHLVMAADPALDGSADDRRLAEIIEGWRRHVSELVTWRAAGNHMTMLKQPHCDALASWLMNFM